MSATIDKDLEFSVSFEKETPGAQVSDACLDEIASRMRVALKNPEETLGTEVKVASDSENILEKNAAGELRVQRDTYHTETQEIAVPPPVAAGGGTYLVPVTRFRIVSVVLVDGTVTPIPDQGQSAGPTYPSDLDELKDNLNGETPPFTWGISGGILTVSSDLGFEIASVVEGGPTVGDAQKVVEAEEIASGIAGTSNLTFSLARTERNIDYASVLMLNLMVTPGSGYSRAYIEKVSASSVEVIVERVAKPLVARLVVFTPAQREDASEF